MPRQARVDTPPLHIGLSGWNYREWRDRFYAGVPQRAWLAHAVRHFNAIEINSTFYRLPRESGVARWRAHAPPGFVYAIKGSRYVTHVQWLNDAAEPVARLRDLVRPLGAALGPVLWQMHPRLKKDLPLLAELLDVLGATWPDARHCVELRHASWFDDETAALLAGRRIANVISHAARFPLWEAVTADLVYVRLHGAPKTYFSQYSLPELAAWAEKIRGWRGEGRAVHVYFDNDADGHAPYDALSLMQRLGVEWSGSAA